MEVIGSTHQLQLSLPDKSGTVDYRAFPNARAEIERLAYFDWLDRGCPMNSAEDDWVHAEQKYWTLKRNALGW